MAIDDVALERVLNILDALSQDDADVPVDADGIRQVAGRLLGVPPDETVEIVLASFLNTAREIAESAQVNPLVLCILQGLRVGHKIGYSEAFDQAMGVA